MDVFVKFGSVGILFCGVILIVVGENGDGISTRGFECCFSRL